MRTILILDDDPTSLNVLFWVLERHYRVLQTSDADDAIELCQHHIEHIGLIVADIVLRSLSGTQVAVRVRKFCPNIPILFTSGTPLEGWREDDFGNLETLISSRVDFIQKPFTAKTLVSKVENLLNGDSARADIQALFEQADTYRRTGLG